MHRGPRLVQWIILFAGLAVLGAVLGNSLLRERARVMAHEREHLFLQASIAQQILDPNLTALDAVLRDLAGYGSLPPGDMNERLDILAQAMNGVLVLAVLDASGTVRASNRRELPGKNYAHRAYFTDIRDNPSRDMFYVAAPFTTSLGTYTLTTGRMIQGPAGEFDGMVLASLDTAYFMPLLNSLLYAPDMRATVVHDSGILLLAAPWSDAAGTNLNIPGSLFSLHLGSGKDCGVYTGPSATSGKERLTAARTIRPQGLNLDHPLVVMVGRDMDALLADWRESAMRQAWLFFMAVAVSVAALGFHQRSQRTSEREVNQAHKALAENERFLRLLADTIPGMVGYWDKDLHNRYANHAYLEWYGRTPGQMAGIAIQELLGPELFAKNEPHIKAALRGEPQTFERTLTKTDGTVGYTLARYTPDRRGDGVAGFFVLVSDVTELKNTQMELERRVKELDVQAATDPLTSLSNRRSFLARADEELERGRRYGLPMVFLMLDVDRFKALNDGHGHGAGDAVLGNLAELMRQTLRATDIIGRLGGDEFAAVLLHTGLQDAMQTAERLRRRAEESGGPIPYTVSIGLACCEDVASVEAGMKLADDALYEAKQAGRNRVAADGNDGGGAEAA